MTPAVTPPVRPAVQRAQGRAGYRLRQFLNGVRASVSEEELLHAARRLPPGGITLLLALPVDAQRHSLNVLATLAAAESATVGATVGATDANADAVPDDLAVAALLHDAGKLAAGGQISLWMRGPLVLLEAFAPGLALRLARPLPESGWRHLLWVQQHHAAIGAAWAKDVGCSPRACALIARHQEKLNPPIGSESEEQVLLRRLQWADNLN